MGTVIDQKAFIALLRAELDKCDPKNDMPDFSALIPSIKAMVAEEVFEYTHYHQTNGAKMMGINRGTYRDLLKSSKLII